MKEGFYCGYFNTETKDGQMCPLFRDGDMPVICKKDVDNKACSLCHRKHPTPKQFQEEYGREWDGSVYVLETWIDCHGNHRHQTGLTYFAALGFYKGAGSYELFEAKEHKTFIICACTPYGRPDPDKDFMSEEGGGN